MCSSRGDEEGLVGHPKLSPVHWSFARQVQRSSDPPQRGQAAGKQKPAKADGCLHIIFTFVTSFFH